MVPRGIATMVDWALMVPCLFGKVHVPPRTVFVHNYFLPHFIESTLKFMDPNYRFVLISGGTDLSMCDLSHCRCAISSIARVR